MDPAFFTFDGEEFEEAADDAAAALFEPPAETASPAPADPGVDAQFRDVEARLEIASYYRMLLNGSLFDNATDAGETVEREVRAFVRDRLAILLGVGVAPPKGNFTAPEIVALKAIAARILKRPAVLVEAAAPKRMRKPATLKASPTPPAARAARMEQRLPEARPPRSPLPAGVKVGSDSEGRTLFREGHRVFTEGKNEKGESYVKDLTPHVRNPLALPMPTGAALEAVTADHASRSVNQSTAGQNRLVALGAAASIANNQGE